MRKESSFLIFSIILMLSIFCGLHFMFSFTPEYPVTNLSKGWNVSYQDQAYLNTDLEHLSSQLKTTFSKGDVLTLNLTKPLLPEKVPFPCLFFKSSFCAYEVYLDDTLIGSRFTEDTSGYTFLGIGYNCIMLPADYSGKKLSIILFVTENECRADILSPMIGNFDDLYRIILTSVTFPAFTSVFLILFGFVFMLISLIFSVKTTGFYSQIICAFLSSIVGLWMINAYNIIDFYVNPSIMTFIEFSAMYLMLPLMYMLIFDLHKGQDNSVAMFLGYSSLAFALLFIALHLLNIVHIQHFRFPYYLMSGIWYVILIFYIVRDIKSKTKTPSTRTLMLGLTVFSWTLAAYGFVGLTQAVVDYRQSIVFNYLVPLGSLFFVITQLLNHFIFMTRSFVQRQEYASLTQIAYIDNLTDIPNRVSADNKLLEIGKTNNDFCILSLDLNGLKAVNDNSGHPAGDRLLKSFAACLKEVFEGTGEYFRIGGDEFLVLFSSIDKNLLDSLLADLDSKLQDLDKTDPEANHSVSYGYAFRSETKDKDTHSVYMLADKRMYQSKQKYYDGLRK